MLCCLFWMTLTAVLICWHEQLLVVISMTFIATDSTLIWFSILSYNTSPNFGITMSTLLPILHNCWGLYGMTKDTFLSLKNTFGLAAWRPIILRIIPANRR